MPIGGEGVSCDLRREIAPRLLHASPRYTNTSIGRLAGSLVPPSIRGHSKCANSFELRDFVKLCATKIISTLYVGRRFDA
jgi:hypothetical protein